MKDKTGLFIMLTILAMAFSLFLCMEQAPAPPECKICHCHKTLCARECSEESMCAMQCQRLCDRRKQ